MDCSSNMLSTEALNSLFKTLPTRTEINGKGDIYISPNPGSNECDKSIAEKKGWNIDRAIPTK